MLSRFLTISIIAILETFTFIKHIYQENFSIDEVCFLVLKNK